MEIEMNEAKITTKAMLLRAIYKQYCDEFKGSNTVAKEVFLIHYPVVRNTSRFTPEEFDYIFRPYEDI